MQTVGQALKTKQDKVKVVFFPKMQNTNYKNTVNDAQTIKKTIKKNDNKTCYNIKKTN